MDVSWQGFGGSTHYDIRDCTTGRHQAYITHALDPQSIVRAREGITDFVKGDDFPDLDVANESEASISASLSL